MVVVTTVAVIVVVVVVVKVWAEAIGNVVVVVEVVAIGVLADVDIIELDVSVIILKFVLPVSYSVNVCSSDVTVGLFMDALAGPVLGVLAGIGVEVL